MTEQNERGSQPFRFIPHEEFAKLSKEDKLAYLARAIEAVARDKPVVVVIDDRKPKP